jgi:hypothetical protein
MTLSKWTAGGIALGVLLLGIGLGRFAAPTKIIERDRLVETSRDTELTWHAYVGRTESKIETKTNWQTVTKWEKDGSVSQTAVAAQEHTEATRTDVTDSSGKIIEKVVERIVEREKIVENAKPDWLLGAGIGTRLDKLTPIYEVAVGRRLLGPVFIAGWAQVSGPSRDGAAVGLRAVLLF